MDIIGTGKRVRVYVGEHDRAPGHHQPLWERLLAMLRDEGAAGATMFRGLAGFGAHSHLHVARVADLVPDLPVVVEWIDSPERVERLLPRICELVDSGMVTVEEISIARYTHRAPRPLPPDTVGQVMTRQVAAVQPDTPLGELVRMLVDRDYRALPVVDPGHHVVGMVTNHDLIERGGLSGRVELLGALAGGALERELAASGVRGKTAADVMTRDVVQVGSHEHLERATHLMVERKLKRLPVVDEQGVLVGMLSRADVLRTMGEGYPAPPPGPSALPAGVRSVGDVMRQDVPVVRADAALGEVLDAVISTRLNRAIVVDAERRVLGVVSDADLLARLDPSEQPGVLSALMGRRPFSGATRGVAHDLIGLSPLTATSETAAADAARLMLESHHKVLPVVDAQGRLIGVADRADLLRAGLG
jgi:CBS domain-containing protein